MVSDSPTAIKAWIAGELRRLLAARKEVTQQALAELVGRTAAHVSHIHTGRNLPSATEMDALLDFYGYSDRKPFFRQLLKAAKKGVDWWEVFGDAVPEWFDLFLGLERSAVQLRSYDAMWVPGLFQTRAYAEALFRGNPEHKEDEVQRLADVRMARQEAIFREESPLRVWRVLDEAVLRRVVGGRDIMIEQLEHLARLTELHNIDMQVLEFSKGAHTGTHGTFTLMTMPPELPTNPVMLYLENRIRGGFIEDPTSILAYGNDLERLQVVADRPENSAAVITRIAEELKAG